MAAMTVNALLLLLAIQGTAASSIYLTDITVNTSDGSISGIAGVNNSGTLGYICDTTGSIGTFIPATNIKVICNQYGYASGTGYQTTFPQGGTVILRNPECTGAEMDIMNCTATSGSVSTSSCPNGAYRVNCNLRYYDMYTNMRLVGGTYSSGYVELRENSNGTWNRVCGDSMWDKYARGVTCRQLGYDDSSSSGIPYFVSAGTYSRSPKCEGEESNLTQCKDSENMYNTSYSLSTCGSASVSCLDPIPEYSFNYISQEIYVNGYWERLCGQPLVTDDEQKSLASTVCKGLGRKYSSHTKNANLVNPTTTQIRSIGCKEAHTNLSACTILKAPNGQGFACYYTLTAICKGEDGDNLDIWSWLGLALRLGFPLLIIGGILIFSLISVCVAKIKKRNMTRQVSQAQRTSRITLAPRAGAVAVGAPGGGYRSGFPRGYTGGQNSPTQSQPAPVTLGVPDAPPPSYEQATYTDWSNNTTTTANTTNDDPNHVPGAPQYVSPNTPHHLPPIRRNTIRQF